MLVLTSSQSIRNFHNKFSSTTKDDDNYDDDDDDYD